MIRIAIAAFLAAKTVVVEGMELDALSRVINHAYDD